MHSLSLRGNLKEEISLPDLIFSSLQKGLENHFKLKNQAVDTEFYARQLGGIFLSYVALPNEESFIKLTIDKKKDIARKHAISIIATLNIDDCKS